MARLLVCLPVCLLLAPAYPGRSLDPREAPTERLDSAQQLPARDPIAFLEKCLAHYDATVKGYSLTFRKQERIDDELQPVEIIEVHCKDEPHSVFLKWLEGARKAVRVVYVEGENDGNMLALPKLIPLIVARDPNGDDAKQSGRYPITEFGLKKATQRVLRGWKKAHADNHLHVEYLGIHKVPEAGNVACYKLRRSRYAKPEEDGVTELTIYLDTENLLQVGSVLRGKDRRLIAEYYFRDIRLNPTFRPDQFTRAALTAKE